MCCENDFGRAFDENFRLRTSGSDLNEERLFIALHESLCALSQNFVIGTYHGSAHLVSYESPYNNPVPGLPPAQARCELCDLMIITYSNSRRELRLACLQAKLETGVNAVRDRTFTVNPVQWYLLAHRPEVLRFNRFYLPQRMLADALLSSVGTFGFFTRLGNAYNIYYSIAEQLALQNLSCKKGRVNSPGIFDLQSVVTPFGTFEECLAAPNSIQFGSALYALKIGTPLSTRHAPSTHVMAWLCSNLEQLGQAYSSYSINLQPVTNLIQFLRQDALPPVGYTVSGFGSRYVAILEVD